MPQKVKKQHYVPQSYLNAWDCSGKHQVYVFDKKTSLKRINNIRDIASEHYFYDINPDEVFSPQVMECLHQSEPVLDCKNDNQYAEQIFAQKIEKPFSDLLNKMISNLSVLTPWFMKNCFFISQEEKAEFSKCLAFQLVRTRQMRNGIMDSADCLTQVLKDMGLPDSEINKYNISKEESKKIHLQMIFNPQNIAEAALCFYNLTWMLGVNRTNSKFFTSDSPIGTRAHVKDPLFSMNGIGSKGVEAFFPISPDAILLMVDGSYHKGFLPLERRIVEITKKENVDHYNSILALRAERFVFSSTDDVMLLDEMITSDPDVFKFPHKQMRWGEKVYYPSNN